MNLRRVVPKEAPAFLASKWLHLDLLIGPAQMADLFLAIEKQAGSLFLFSTLGPKAVGQNYLTQEHFLTVWQSYIATLQEGRLPLDADFRFFFTAVLTATTDAVVAIDVSGDKEIISPVEPIVQMQLHRFIYSHTDESFRSMVFGQNAISWGVRLSYPGVFQHPLTRIVEDASDDERFINAAIFSTIRKWIREHTMPTPFVVGEKRVNVPIRIGKECLSWINNHPELQQIKVHV